MPRKTTPKNDHLVWKIAGQSPKSSAGKIRPTLLVKGVGHSQRTINWHLVYEFGLKAHKLSHKPRLTQAMKDKRLGFNKCYVQTNLLCSSSVHASATSANT